MELKGGELCVDNPALVQESEFGMAIPTTSQMRNIKTLYL